MSADSKEIREKIIETCREQLDALVASIQEGLDKGRPSYAPLLACVVALMQELHKVRGLSGAEKKELLKDVIIEALSAHLSEEELDIVSASLDTAVDTLWTLGQKVIFPAIRRCKALCC